MTALFFFSPFCRITFLNELCYWKNSIWLLVSVVFCLPKEIPQFYAAKLLCLNFKNLVSKWIGWKKFFKKILIIRTEGKMWNLSPVEKELGSFVQSFNKWVSSVRFSRYSSEQDRLYYVNNQNHKIFIQLLVIFEWLLAIFLRCGRP